MDQDSSANGSHTVTEGDISLSTPPPIVNEFPTPSIDNLLSSQEIPDKFANKSLHPKVAVAGPSLAESSTSASADIGEVQFFRDPVTPEESGEKIPSSESVENPGLIPVTDPPRFINTPNIINLSNVENIEEWELKGEGNHIYIGRKVDKETKKHPGSKWGNPKLNDHDNNRKTVINLFKTHCMNDEDMMKSVGELKDKILGCYCAPDQCHGEFLHQLAGNVPHYEGGNNPNVQSVSSEDTDLSPGTKLMNVLSAAIENETILENSTNSTTPVSPVVPVGRSDTLTADTIDAYSSILDISHLSTVSKCQSSYTSQNTVIEESKINIRNRSGSDPFPEVRTIRVMANPFQDIMIKTNSDTVNSSINDCTTHSTGVAPSEKLSKSVPNLLSTDSDQKFEIDPQALTNVLWCMNRKIEDFENKFVNVYNKIEYLDVYFKTLITEQFANLEKRLNISTENCERSCRANFDTLIGKIEDCVNENEVIRTQWKDHMVRLKANIELMEGDGEDSESDTDEESNLIDRRRPTRNVDGERTEKKVEELEKLVEKLNEKMFDLDCRVVECEQYSRRENMVITGIPENIEDINQLESTIITTLENLGIYIDQKDISACHRLGPYKQNARYPRSVIVRFVNRKIVHHALNNRDKLWGLKDVLHMNLRFYESLCSLNNESRKLCNDLQRRGEIHSFSIRDGFVKIVANEGDRPVKIRHPELLKKRYAV